jgi:folate-binding protein YgfZ
MSISIDDIRFEGNTFNLEEWQLFKVSGEDREDFFHGQTTNNLKTLATNNFQLDSRLNRQGRVLAFFLLGKTSEYLWLIIPKERAESLVNDLEKFIIMEDVVIENISTNLKVSLGPVINNESKLSGVFYGELASISWTEENDQSLPNIEEAENLRMLSGFPSWGKDVSKNSLLNETMLEELAIDYKKGCFLGQETVSKIHNGRGASTFPTLIKLETSIDLEHGEKIYLEDKKVGEARGVINYNNSSFLKLTLSRDLRVKGKQLKLNTKSGLEIIGLVQYLPMFHGGSPELKAIELHDKAVDKFHQGLAQEALILLERAIELKPDYADAVEILGVILGQLEEYEKGIQYMDELLAIDEKSVMAHTNKSLFYMRLGRIEEAEEEKSKATLKSFKRFGDEAKEKKILEEQKKQEEADIKRRESMFLQVIEIDPEDTIANFGMGDISFARSDFSEAKTYLSKVLDVDKKYSMAYLVLGKTLESLNENEEAKQVYLKGIEIASKQGNMMPANEMQSRYAKLTQKS